MKAARRPLFRAVIVPLLGAALCTSVLAMSASATTKSHLVSHAKLTQISLALSWEEDVQNFGYVYAEAAGLYKKFGLNVNFIQESSAVSPIQIVAAHQALLGVSDPSSVLEAEKQGIHVTAIDVTLQSSPTSLTCRQDSGITSLSEVVTKHATVALKTGAVSIWDALLALNKISVSSIPTIPIASTDVSEIIANKAQCEFSTYLFNEPNEIRAAGVPVNVMLVSNMGYPEQAGPVVTASDTYTKNETTLAKFYAATELGWAKLVKSPDFAATWIIKQGYVPGLSLTAQEQVAAGFKQLLVDPFTKQSGHGILYPDLKQWEDNDVVLLKTGLISSIASVHGAVTDQIGNMANAMLASGKY